MTGDILSLALATSWGYDSNPFHTLQAETTLNGGVVSSSTGSVYAPTDGAERADVMYGPASRMRSASSRITGDYESPVQRDSTQPYNDANSIRRRADKIIFSLKPDYFCV